MLKSNLIKLDILSRINFLKSNNQLKTVKLEIIGIRNRNASFNFIYIFLYVEIIYHNLS